ncbi:MAG: hypothetical protein ACJATU_000899 [Rickettsiales bacterium]|jgi:hypothetical protein
MPKSDSERSSSPEIEGLEDAVAGLEIYQQEVDTQIDGIKKQIDEGVTPENLAEQLSGDKEKRLIQEVAEHFSGKKPPFDAANHLFDLLEDIQTKDTFIEKYLTNPENTITPEQFNLLSSKITDGFIKHGVQQEYSDKNPPKQSSSIARPPSPDTSSRRGSLDVKSVTGEQELGKSTGL